MKAVMHDVGVRHGLGRADNKGRAHVHRCRHDLGALFFRQCIPKLYAGLGASIRHDFQHASSVLIGHQRQSEDVRS